MTKKKPESEIVFEHHQKMVQDDRGILVTHDFVVITDKNGKRFALMGQPLDEDEYNQLLS